MSRFLWLFIVITSAPSMASVNFSDLLHSDHVIVDSYLSQKRSVVGEQLTLNIDIRSKTWFTKGTMINRFEIDNTLVLLQDANSINGSATVKGDKYLQQLWEIPLFPTKSGEFVVPPIAIKLQVKYGEQSIEGVVLTQPLGFEAFQPTASFLGETPWLVADNVKLDQKMLVTSIEKDNDDNILKVGDSIERVVSLSAGGTTSMLMPELVEVDDYAQDNVRVYTNAPERLDRQARGVRHSSLRESVILVLEQPGEVVLPDIELIWWDVDSQTEQTAYIKGDTWLVKHTFSSYVRAKWSYILLVIGALCTSFYFISNWKRISQHLKEINCFPLPLQLMISVLFEQLGHTETILYKFIRVRHKRYTFVEGNQNTELTNIVTKYKSYRYAFNTKFRKAKSHMVKIVTIVLIDRAK